MSLWQIAASNVWRNRGRYAAYLTSAAFAVMVYFIYTALAHHPQLVSGGFGGASGVVPAMKAASVMIAGITFLYLLTSNTAFVRSRKKEFGLLSLLGLSRKQLAALILWEGLLIGLAALGIGLALGLLFLRLFFMAVSALMQLSATLPLYAGPEVWLQSIAIFGSSFVLVSLFSLKDVLRSNVIELVRAERKPKAAPTFSRCRAALGVILVGGGYIWASVPNMSVVMLGIFPVTIIVSVGTYLLMREASIAALAWLKQREPFYFRPGPFMVVSQLGFKLQENYRVLSQVAVTVAVVVSVMGTIFSFYVATTDQLQDLYPYSFQVVEREGDRPLSQQVRGLLRQHGVEVTAEREFHTAEIELVKGDGGEESAQTGMLVPYSTYAQARSQHGLVPLPGEQVILVKPYSPVFNMSTEPTPETWEVRVGGQSHSVTALMETGGPLFNRNWSIAYALVLPDAQYEAWLADTPMEQRVAITAWTVRDWLGPEATAAAGALAGLAGSGEENGFPQVSIPSAAFRATMAGYGVALFVGLFVSLVFLVASSSILYFRLFNEIDEDRRYFRRLRDLGVSTRELGVVSLGQTMVLFLVPFLVGLLHSTFAMQALGTLLRRTVLHYGWMVAAGFLVLYGLYYVVTYTVYCRSLSNGSQEA